MPTLTKDDTASPHLERLRLATHGLAAPFACGGSLPTKHPLTLCFGDGARFVIPPDRLAHAWFSRMSVAPLLEHCQPAPFGHGGATRHDPRVRDALQLRAVGDALAVLDFDPAANGILELVRKALCPDDPNPLVAELYGLNVYSTGGHFVPHKDTPRGADMLGTLVVCLPIQFAGGEFVISHQGVSKTFDWSAGRHAHGADDEIRWAAFFGDVDHEVKPVRTGHRVTLTWLLRRGAGKPLPVRAGPPGDPIDEALATSLADPEFLANGGVVGFRCEHLYSETPGFRRAMAPLDARSVLKLKGRDQRVAKAALAAGLTVELKAYVTEADCDETWRLARFPTAKELSVFDTDQLTPDEIEEALPVEAHADYYQPDDGIRWISPELGSKQPGGAATEFLGAMEYSTTGYFGNEGGDAEFYLSAALLVTVPSWARRRPKRAPKKGGSAPVKATTVAPASRRAGSKTPAGEFMAAELHAMGHGPADIRRMLKEGSLERAGFGWYRFVR
jgi:hypothetical protein